jgi:hypothetical protein
MPTRRVKKGALLFINGVQYLEGCVDEFTDLQIAQHFEALEKVEWDVPVSEVPVLDDKPAKKK